MLSREEVPQGPQKSHDGNHNNDRERPICYGVIEPAKVSPVRAGRISKFTDVNGFIKVGAKREEWRMKM